MGLVYFFSYVLTLSYQPDGFIDVCITYMHRIAIPIIYTPDIAQYNLLAQNEPLLAKLL